MSSKAMAVERSRNCAPPVSCSLQRPSHPLITMPGALLTDLYAVEALAASADSAIR